MLVLTYTDEDMVEVIEIGHAGDGGEEVFFDGVQLTFSWVGGRFSASGGFARAW
jgi:hypothetical protein